MVARTREPDKAEGLWLWSLDFYGRPGVEAACLALQDEHGVDVNLILFAVWAGAEEGRALSAEEIARGAAAARAWTAEAVGPLRALRRRLKGRARARALRDLVKAAELEAERLAQGLILEAVGAGVSARGSRDLAARNLALASPAGADAETAALIAALD